MSNLANSFYIKKSRVSKGIHYLPNFRKTEIGYLLEINEVVFMVTQSQY